MANIAYLRVSTTDQSLDRQLADTGIMFDKTFEDKASGGSMDRPALTNMLDYIIHAEQQIYNYFSQWGNTSI